MKTVPRILLGFLLALLLSAGACHPFATRSATALLDDVESYINDRPDSALVVLQGVDSTTLTTRALRARYSLLHVMALDKCYLDITTPGLLDPAVAWYSRHGTPDERIKSLFYRGRIAQDKGNINETAIFFHRAESLSEKAVDEHAKGLLYLGMANLFQAVYNIGKEEEYVDRGLSVLEKANDSLYYSALGLKALVYHQKQKWASADSLYRISIENTTSNPSALKHFLSNYAKLKLHQPEKDPTGAIILLNRIRTECGFSLSPEEAAIYAYAQELLGNRKASDKLFDQLDQMGATTAPIFMWRARIAEHRGEMGAALLYTQRSHLAEKELIDSVLKDSVTQTLQSEAENSLAQSQQHLRVVELLCLLVLCVISLVWINLLFRKKKRESEWERLLAAREALINEHNALSKHLQLRDDEIVKNEAIIASQEEQIKSLSSGLQVARDTYTRERLARLQQVGWLKNVLWENAETRLSDRNALARLRSDLSYIHELDGDGVVLVRRLDKELDGLISQLRKELQLRGRPKEVLFLCGCLLNLDTRLLAEMLNTTSANIYVKKHRLKKHIETLAQTDGRYKPLLDCLQ